MNDPQYMAHQIDVLHRLVLIFLVVMAVIGVVHGLVVYFHSSGVEQAAKILAGVAWIAGGVASGYFAINNHC